MKTLLDTNAYTAWKRGEAAVTELVRRSEELVLSSIVAGELLFGFRCGSQFERNRRELDDLLRSPYVSFLPVTLVTADRFARVAAALRRKGRPLPTNDVWIAAHAMESGADLVSFDRHFGEIDGLAWVDPAAG
ncbi:type II toxin-antitoxin system VapC family toxin [Candidatus Binatia bacterium]|nr:type II toxin-antitoxin system VapC family toxin [Candidatus Binatia bacterium]